MIMETTFRIWDSKKQKYLQDSEYSELAITMSGAIIKCHAESSESPVQYLDNVTAEFSTGLKDRNGKEIYEGDIIRLLGHQVEMPIVFKDGAFCVHGYNWDSKSSIVIGNIHQHS